MDNKGYRVFLLVSLFFFVAPLWSDTSLPTYQEIKAGFKPSDVLYFDRSGSPLQSVRTRFDFRSEEWVELKDISPFLIQTVLYSEDRKFFEHSGIDSLAFLGSIWRRLLGLPLRGGSTISMQLVGLIVPELAMFGQRRSLSQKLKQIQKATELEETWTKNEILAAYFNLIYYRGELKGIGSASRGLFGKSALHLTKNESYLLAVLIRAPEASISRIGERACKLKLMLEEESNRNCEEILAFTRNTLFQFINYKSSPSFAPHFVNLVMKSNVETRITSLDLDLQRRVLQILQDNLRPLRSQMVDDGAVIVFHNQTGQVLAYVANLGSESGAPSIDLIQVKRQAGSTLKPFVYAQSFEERKLTPSSVLNDAPIDIPVFRGIYRPLNYDKSYQGKVTVRQSLGSSLNIPAVRALSYLDMGSFLGKLASLGFKNLAYPEFYGPSLALGTADVSLWDLTNAYRTFSNLGIYTEGSLLFQEIRALQSNVTSPFQSKEMTPDRGVRIFRDSVSFVISHILSDREARALSFGWENNLSTPFFTAVKTGTSQDMRDNWCIGYSQDFTVGVWVGNIKGNPMRDISGVTGAGPVWREVMEHLHRDLPSLPHSIPKSVGYDSSKKEYYEIGMEGILDVNPNFSFLQIPIKITSPSPETIFAFDPDIPAPHQKILFRLNSYNMKLRWYLNQKPLGNASGPFFWDVEKGAFVLELRDETGKELDRVNFEVR
jgi:penicillin-binding protein 1C